MEIIIKFLTKLKIACLKSFSQKLPDSITAETILKLLNMVKMSPGSETS